MLLFRLGDYTRLPALHVSFVGPSGVRHSVEVTAESLYEGAALGLTLFCKDGRTETIGPGTELEVQVRQRAARHTVTLAQVRRWCDAVTSVLTRR